MVLKEANKIRNNVLISNQNYQKQLVSDYHMQIEFDLPLKLCFFDKFQNNSLTLK